MTKVELIHQDDSIDYQKILFERPINRLHAKHIGIIACRNINLSKLSKIHQIINEFRYDMYIVSEPEIKELGVPSDIYLATHNKNSVVYSNSDDAIDILNNCNYSIIGMGFAGNSKMRLLQEKIVDSTNSSLIIYPSCFSMFSTSPNILNDREGDLLVSDYSSLVSLIKYLDLDTSINPDSSILNIVQSLICVADSQKSHVVYFQRNQIIFVNYLDQESVGVINFDKQLVNKLVGEYLAILISLLCDSAQLEQSIVQRSLTAGYLMKKYLDDYSSFKNAIR